MDTFVAIDVETANSDYSSICQVGTAFFENGRMVDSFKTYVDPEDYFDMMNISIHGIDSQTVQGAPVFPKVHKILAEHLAGHIFVHHTAFDRLSINRAAGKYGLPPLNVQWLDSARVVRRVWETFRYSGYGLENLANHFGLEFNHHDALEDARVAGEILWKAVSESGHSLTEWLSLSQKNITPASISMDGNPNGIFYGETLVFTGVLSIPRLKAASLGAQAGCKVDSGVNAKTTMLVVGAQDLRKLGGQEKSSKHRKAEELILKGQRIRIMSEADFQEMVNCY